MSTIKISELDGFSNIIPEDFIPLVDSSSMTTFRVTLNSINNYISESVTVKNSIYSTFTTSASYASSSISSSHTLTASYLINNIANPSSSWSSASLFALQSTSASYALASTTALNQTGGTIRPTDAIIDNLIVLGKNSNRDLFPIIPNVNAPNGTLHLIGATNDYAQLFLSGSSDNGSLYIRTGDNGSEPFIFQTWDTFNNDLAPVDRFKIAVTDTSSMTTSVTAYGDITASKFLSNVQNGIGFYGTASYANATSTVLLSNSSSVSVTSSYSITASYISPLNLPGMAKAWGYIIIPTASNGSSLSPAAVAAANVNNKPIIVSSYNISDVSWCASTMSAAPGFSFLPYPYSASNGNSWVNVIVSMNNPLQNVTYSAHGTWAEQGNSYEIAAVTVYPWARRSTTQFTMSLGNGGNYGPEFDTAGGSNWIHFVVY